jgi:hypothetical protein
MYHILKKGEEGDMFTEETAKKIALSIAKETAIKLKEMGTFKSNLKGCLSLHGVSLKGGGTTNLWVEYSLKIIELESGYRVDTGVHDIILYDDEVPDVILDRYNKFKKNL